MATANIPAGDSVGSAATKEAKTKIRIDKQFAIVRMALLHLVSAMGDSLNSETLRDYINRINITIFIKFAN